MTPLVDLSHDDVQALRRRVRSSGFGLLSDAIAPTVLRGLRDEAEERRSDAKFAEQTAGVRFRSSIAALGPKASGFLRDRQLAGLLSAVFGAAFVLTEDRSCLTFYDEGDHLGAHRDEPATECVVTIIVYLTVSGPSPRPPRSGLELRVYGREMTESCPTRVTIPTRPGALVIGLGSEFWHERPMLEQGEQVSALTACYQRDQDCERRADHRAGDSTG